MKKITAILLIITALFVFAGCGSSDVPTYDVYTSANFYDDNLNMGYGYRVVVDSSLSEKELWAIYDDICEDDDGNLHRVWFYSSQEMARSPYTYDVACIEQSEADGEAVYTKAEANSTATTDSKDTADDDGSAE